MELINEILINWNLNSRRWLLAAVLVQVCKLNTQWGRVFLKGWWREESGACSPRPGAALHVRVRGGSPQTVSAATSSAQQANKVPFLSHDPMRLLFQGTDFGRGNNGF